MNKIINVFFGVLLYCIGVLLIFAVIFSKANIFKHLLNLLKGKNLGFDSYEYSYNASIVLANCLFILISYYLFKKGNKLVRSNQTGQNPDDDHID